MTLSLSGQIQMDFSNSMNCTNKHFISVQESDVNWKRYGVEKDAKPNSDTKTFNLKSFYSFQKNKYYIVKFAVGAP